MIIHILCLSYNVRRQCEEQRKCVWECGVYGRIPRSSRLHPPLCADAVFAWGDYHERTSPFAFTYVLSFDLHGSVEIERLTVCGVSIRVLQATVVLIVGYSWIDGHLTVFDPPGIGWPIAWRRWVLVVIGTIPSNLEFLHSLLNLIHEQDLLPPSSS